MMDGAVPLLVNVGVAALAGLRLHEELPGNHLAFGNLRGTWKERAVRAVAFAVHRFRRRLRIANVMRSLPVRLTPPPRRRAESDQHGNHNECARRSSNESGSEHAR